MEIIYPDSFLNLTDNQYINENQYFNEDYFDQRDSPELETSNNPYEFFDEFEIYPEFIDSSAVSDSKIRWPNSYNTGPNSKPPMGPPPSYTPSKAGKNVKSLGSVSGAYSKNPQAKYVPYDSIRFCLYKYTYIWQRNGRSYWAFLIRADRTSITGFRWVNYRWSYFGADLRTIDSFECY